MDLDFAALGEPERYKLLTAAITPRPIAWITSQSAAGQRNAAPFSFFNAFSAEPPILGIGIGDHAPGRPKDTKRNIRETGEFVVNIVDEASVEAMNRTATPFGAEVDELAAVGLEAAASCAVRPPRLARSPVSFECVLHQEIVLGGGSSLLLGRVVFAHVADAVLRDAARLHLDAPGLQTVGRMHGGGMYARTGDQFRLDRIALEDWPDQVGRAGPGSGEGEPSPERRAPEGSR